MAGVSETVGFHLVPIELCMSGTPVVLTFIVQLMVHKLLLEPFLIFFIGVLEISQNLTM